MRKKLRTYKIAVGLAALALVVAGCGGDSGDDGGDGGDGGNAAAGGEDLLIWTGTGPGGEATKEIGAAFGEENGVDVKVEIVPGDNLQSQFVTAAQAGDPPDVVMGAHDWIGNLVQNGTIDPIQIPEATASTFQPLAIDAVTFNGQTYGMPFTMNNIVLFRNTDLAPDAPKTVEEMVSTGQDLVKQGKAEVPLACPVGDTGNPYFINPLYTLGRRLHVRADRRRNLRPQATWVSERRARSRPTRRSARSARRARACSSGRSPPTTRSPCSPRARRRSWSRARGS